MNTDAPSRRDPCQRRQLASFTTGFAIAALVSLVAIVLLARSARQAREATQIGIDPGAAERYREYCQLVRVALELDVRDLENRDHPKVRSQAANRFYEFGPQDTLREILLCAPIPPDLGARNMCWIANDYACLARLARLARASIPDIRR